MPSRKNDDIAKGHTIVPSHHPMPGVDDEPIDAETRAIEPGNEKTGEEGKTSRPEPGISPSTEKNRLF